MSDPNTIPDWVGIRPWKELDLLLVDFGIRFDDYVARIPDGKSCAFSSLALEAIRLERERVLARLREGIASFAGPGPHHFSEETRLVVIAALRGFAGNITHAGVSKEEAIARSKAKEPMRDKEGNPVTIMGMPVYIDPDMPSDVPVEFTPIPEWARENP